MIKIDLITGFLGAGKTTFLLGYARYLMRQGLRIGILEYDYGAINVDMLLLNQLRGKNCELEMVAAACDEDCLRRRFTTKLISMAMSGYDRIIVEPSGVFDMDMFFDALRDEPLEKWYEIGSVITIVNANLNEDIGEEADFFLASQAAYAGKIVLSRTTLTDAATINRTIEHLKKAADRIRCDKLSKNVESMIVKGDWALFTDDDYARLSNCGYRIYDYAKVITQDEMNYSSVYLLDLKDGLESVKVKVKEVFSNKEYGDVVRVKGFVLDNGISYQINASEYEILVSEIAIGQGVMIVIGNNLNEDKIKSLMQA